MWVRCGWWVLVAACGVGLAAGAAVAQGDAGAGSGCALKDHVYTCDGARFQRALASAKMASIETHNVDGVARSQLTSLITKKLGKTIAPEGGPADLVFLMIPIGQDGVVNMSSGDLGTLRIYSTTADGAKAQLLWAETYSGDIDLPWPAVVNRLIGQFQARFHIK
jgi:hypothetical protein